MGNFASASRVTSCIHLSVSFILKQSTLFKLIFLSLRPIYKWVLKPAWLQMKTPCAVEMPRAVPGLVWGQRALLASGACSQLHSMAAAHCNVSQVWVGLLCPQLYHSWHKSALRAWFLWGSLALCYGGHHAMSKMQSKRLLGTARAGLGCGMHSVNWLWRGTAAQCVNHHPLPMAGTTWHLKHQETLYKKKASRPIKTCHLYCSCTLIGQH